MTRTPRRTAAILLTAAALTATVLVAATLIPAAQPGRAAAAAAPTKRDRIKVLTAVLNRMRTEYKKINTSPGAEDIFDYQIGNLWRQGIDGTGTTIAVIEGWADPHIGSFIASQDKVYGLPNPKITTIFPSGDHRLPATCPPGMVRLGSYGSCQGWVGELELDVLAAHLIAPYARILISVTPADSQLTDDAASQVAPPEMMQALEYISARHLANVISISTGTGEGTYRHGREEIFAQVPGQLAAAAAGIPVLEGTGDCDAAQHLAVGPGSCDPRTTTTGRATAAWDDSPWVTAVGGSTPNLSDATGRRLGLDPLWNFAPFGFAAGEGAGYSAVFARPAFQNGVASATRSRMRSVPDITMDSSDGTSEAGPLLAGVLALATQLNHGRSVGPLNDVLYRVLGPAGTRDGIADVVQGNDNLIENGKVVVRGFAAARGFDVASGWGTIRADRFVPALVAATVAARQDRAVRRQAATALSRLEHRVALSRGSIGAGQTSHLSASGFLPRHPVILFIDGRRIRVLHASAGGSVRYLINPAALGLPAGRHRLRLVSMLLTASRAFRTG